MIKYNNIITVLVTVSVNQKTWVGGRSFVWLWLLFPSMFVYIFLYLLHCALFFWPQVCPLTPKSLAFAVWVSKMHHAAAKHVQRKSKTERERDREKQGKLGGEEGSRANYSPEKTKGYISMIPPAVLFMSCVLSLSVTFTSTLALSEGKQAKMPWCSIFHFPSFFHFFSSAGCGEHTHCLFDSEFC